MDLNASWLVLSMLSPMAFSKRIQFTDQTPITLSPYSRESNIIVLEAKGPAAGNADVDTGDSEELLANQAERNLGMSAFGGYGYERLQRAVQEVLWGHREVSPVVLVVCCVDLIGDIDITMSRLNGHSRRSNSLHGKETVTQRCFSARWKKTYCSLSCAHCVAIAHSIVEDLGALVCLYLIAILSVRAVLHHIYPPGFHSVHRYSNRGLVRDSFERLHAKSARDNGDNVECAKALVCRGPSATTGVEGYYAPDGTQTSRSLLFRPGGGEDVVNMLIFLKVSRENARS